MGGQVVFADLQRGVMAGHRYHGLPFRLVAGSNFGERKAKTIQDFDAKSRKGTVYIIEKTTAFVAARACHTNGEEPGSSRRVKHG